MPEGAGPHPCVVMAHGFSAVREQRLDAYAERFAAAGLAVLVFDYRHFGASQGEPRQLLSIAPPAGRLARRRGPRAQSAGGRPEARSRLGLVASAAGTWLPWPLRTRHRRRGLTGAVHRRALRDRRRRRRPGAEADRRRAARRPGHAAAARPVVPARRGPARVGGGHDRAGGRARLRADRPARQHVGEPRGRPDRPGRGRLPPVREVPQAAPARVGGGVRQRRHHAAGPRRSRRPRSRPTPSWCATRSATSRSTSIPSSRPP